MAGKITASEQQHGSSAPRAGGLTSEQIREFKEEGYLIARQMLPLDALQPLIDELTQKVEGARGIADADLPDSSIVTCEVDAGDVLLTMERLVHRSIPNRSQTVRWSVDTGYNRIGLPTGRSKVPGFVARSREHPEKVARSHHDWIQNLAEAGLDRWLQPL